MWAFPIIRVIGLLSELGFRFGLTPGAWVFHWACLLFEPGKLACEPIFQTLSVAPPALVYGVRRQGL